MITLLGTLIIGIPQKFLSTFTLGTVANRSGSSGVSHSKCGFVRCRSWCGRFTSSTGPVPAVWGWRAATNRIQWGNRYGWQWQKYERPSQEHVIPPLVLCEDRRIDFGDVPVRGLCTDAAKSSVSRSTRDKQELPPLTRCCRCLLLQLSATRKNETASSVPSRRNTPLKCLARLLCRSLRRPKDRRLVPIFSARPLAVVPRERLSL
jgi:hypothetical protein